MHKQTAQQALSYFNNFLQSLSNIEQKLQQLSAPDLSPELFKADFRKLIKLLTRATSNLRLCRESLFRLTELSPELRTQIDKLNDQTIRFQRLFIMKSQLPERALERFSQLEIEQTKQIFYPFIQHLIEEKQ